jgi:hypothetical protein
LHQKGWSVLVQLAPGAGDPAEFSVQYQSLERTHQIGMDIALF